ncbi:MAG: phosphoribosylanthranilate isomerase [Dehalococcoidia bacterium]|nr:phosphoribosylanthranilate isomerase [Dehalococcoidia bacterium]
MHGLTVKICGLTEESHLLAVAAAGADYAGLVFAESRRRVSPQRAREITRVLDAMSARPKVVGVFVNSPLRFVNDTAELCGLDFVQLSGDETAEYCSGVERPIIRSVHVSTLTTIEDIERIVTAQQDARTGSADIFLLDTGGKGVYGGTGRTFDWALARAVLSHHPFMVAGGLSPDNVGRLVREVNPAGVDVSSGVERNGIKDESLIRAFVDEARMAGQEN